MPAVRPPGASSANPAAVVCDGDGDARPAAGLAACLGPGLGWEAAARRTLGAELPEQEGAGGRDADGGTDTDGGGRVSHQTTARATFPLAGGPGGARGSSTAPVHPPDRTGTFTSDAVLPSLPTWWGRAPPLAAVLGRLLTQRGSLGAVSPELPPTGFPNPVWGPSRCVQKLESGRPRAGGGRRSGGGFCCGVSCQGPRVPRGPAVSTQPPAGTLTGDPGLDTRSGARTQLSGREAAGPRASGVDTGRHSGAAQRLPRQAAENGACARLALPCPSARLPFPASEEL